MCHHTGDFVKGLRDAEEISLKLSEYEGKLHKEDELTFFYDFAYINFGAGNFNKALHWLNKVLNDNENELRQDLYSYARLFNLVIHFELGNHDLLEYTIKSTARYLQKRDRDYPIEKTIMEYMKKLIRTQNQADRKKMFEQFRNELNKLMKGPEDKIILRYFDYLKWIESKINNVSFSEAIKASN